jgi:hypothetical protein
MSIADFAGDEATIRGNPDEQISALATIESKDFRRRVRLVPATFPKPYSALEANIQAP